MSQIYTMPLMARHFFSRRENGIWGGCPWQDANREEDHGLEGCHPNGLQWLGHFDGHRCRAVFWQSVANIDSDGPSSQTSKYELLRRDPDWQPSTSLNREDAWIDADGQLSRACDSRTFMGAVISPRLKVFGLDVGDFCFVCFNGSIKAAQIYDAGPLDKLGEISQALAHALEIDDNPRSGGLHKPASMTYPEFWANRDVSDRTICTLAFPGSGSHRAVSLVEQWECATRCFGWLTGRTQA